jgi:hypothetical protein
VFDTGAALQLDGVVRRLRRAWLSGLVTATRCGRTGKRQPLQPLRTAAAPAWASDDHRARLAAVRFWRRLEHGGLGRMRFHPASVVNTAANSATHVPRCSELVGPPTTARPALFCLLDHPSIGPVLVNSISASTAASTTSGVLPGATVALMPNSR